MSRSNHFLDIKSGSRAVTLQRREPVGPKVTALVYVAARAPDAAEDFVGLSGKFPTMPVRAGVQERDGQVGKSNRAEAGRRSQDESVLGRYFRARQLQRNWGQTAIIYNRTGRRSTPLAGPIRRLAALRRLANRAKLRFNCRVHASAEFPQDPQDARRCNGSGDPRGSISP